MFVMPCIKDDHTRDRRILKDIINLVFGYRNRIVGLSVVLFSGMHIAKYVHGVPHSVFIFGTFE